MKANKLFIGLATIAATTQMFMACSSDDMTNQSGVMNGNNKAISLTSSFGTMRGTTDPQTTQLNTAVEVGAFGVTGSTTITNGNNNQYSVAANGDLSATNEMTWPTEGDVNIYAYAPYQENWTYNTANDFTVATNQATDAGYLASDLVYGIPTSNPVSQTENRVALSFKHKLAKLNITIQKAQESTLDLSAGKVTITNTKIATTLNPSTGVVGDASGDATDITAVSALGEATTACAIIVPQDIAVGTRLVKIEADSKILYAKLGTATTFEGGKSYNFTVNVGNVTEPEVEVTLQLGSTAVANWEDQDLGAADADDKLYASFGTPGSNAGYNATTNTYTWSAGNGNLMNCFTFANGELANYTTLKFNFTDITEGKAVRINILYSDNTNNDKNYYSAGEKTESISGLLKEGKTAADVTAIRFGGANVSSSAGSCVIKASEMYLE